MPKVAPLSTGFLIVSMIGFLTSALYIPQFSRTWAFAFGLVFTFMFVASMISMVRGPPGPQLEPRPRPLH